MSLRPSPRVGQLLCGLCLGIGLILAVAADSECADSDPLARPEFDRELSIGMEGIDIVAVYRSIAAITRVPFLLDFDRDPTLKVTLKATNMVCRGILASLASAYDLEYSSMNGGVVVRRRGLPATTGGIAVGPALRASQPSYWFDLAARDAQGRTQPFRRLTRQLGVFEPLVFYWGTGHPDTTIAALNQRRGTIDQHNVGAFELTLGVKSDNGVGLELIAELVTRQRIDDRRHTEMRAISTAFASAGDLVLFGIDDGFEVILKAWGRDPCGGDSAPCVPERGTRTPN